MSDSPDDELEARMPTRTKIVAGLVGSVLLLIMLWFSLRMASPLIAADAVAPAGHFQLPCGVCHRISAAGVQQ